MQHRKRRRGWLVGGLALLLFAGCQSRCEHAAARLCEQEELGLAAQDFGFARDKRWRAQWRATCLAHRNYECTVHRSQLPPATTPLPHAGRTTGAATAGGPREQGVVSTGRGV